MTSMVTGVEAMLGEGAEVEVSEKESLALPEEPSENSLSSSSSLRAAEERLAERTEMEAMEELGRVE